VDILLSRLVKQGIDGRSLDLTKEEYPSGPVVKKELPVRTGVDKEMSKKIVKLIKDSNIKVQASIMDDIIRVTGKKTDDLQEVIAMLRGSKLEIPLQFVNMKS
jgi:cyclic-di-GMP-binding protein